MFRKNIQTEDLIDILSKQTTLMNDVESYKNQRRLEIDRKRYLDNSFSLDQDMNSDRHIFDNIVTGADFELYLKDLFCQLGYEVITTKASGDQGADLIISKNGIKKVVQAKFYSSSVGNKAVQEVIGAIKFYKADLGMVITNNYYTKSAIELASVNNIELINGDDLIDLRERAFA
ncbi:TPA: restriction endonuclease [Clostridioides difficile]|nr:restriction endonuclease [Clostridioides difficile]